MAAEPAFLLVRPFFVPQLQIGDDQIIQASPAAAALYGFDRPEQLLFRYMSDLQTTASRAAGRARWALREEGYDVPATYCTLIQRPDGELAGYQGRLLSSNMGGSAYLTQLNEVTELDEPAIPDVPDELLIKHNGRFPVRKIREMLAQNDLRLPYLETFKIIVARCEDLSTQVLGWPPGTGLDLALRSDLTSITLHEQASTAVYLRVGCPHCRRQWDAKKLVTRQCPSCFAYVAAPQVGVACAPAAGVAPFAAVGVSV